MNLTGTDVNKNTVDLPQPLSIVINQEEKTPADDIVMVFGGGVFPQDIIEFVLYENQTLIFKGIADVIKTEVTAEGVHTVVEGRSLCGRLLDNEAMPTVYNYPCESIIFNEYAKKFGVIKSDDSDEVYRGRFAVEKGVAMWQVAENFCKNLFGTTPRLDETGVLHMRGMPINQTLVFADDGQGTAYNKLTETKKISGLVSSVIARADYGSGYIMRFDNEFAQNKGAVAVRYLDASNEKTPIACADKILEQSNSGYYGMVIEAPLFVASSLGASVVVKNKFLGQIEGLVVTKVKASITGKTEKTVLTLKKV